jgi:putative photosynthetic complex assembly protein 2
MSVLAPMAFAVILWWASTGLIFYLDSLPKRTFIWSMAGATAALAAGLAAMWWLRNETTPLGAYAAFAAAVAAWGWLEMSFYMGFITGPRKHRCAAGCHGLAHFGHAVQVNLWHEIAIMALTALIAGLLWSAANATGFWIFLMLWLMHLSARLNVFLGVRNVSEEFVPAHLDVLKGFLRRRNMNALFPISIAALSALTLWLSHAAVNAADGFTHLQLVLAATLSALGLIEHILLMLPLPVERLWTWALARRDGKKPAADRPRQDHLSNVKPLTRPMGV